MQLYLPFLLPSGFGFLGSFGAITRIRGFAPRSGVLSHACHLDRVLSASSRLLEVASDLLLMRCLILRPTTAAAHCLTLRHRGRSWERALQRLSRLLVRGSAEGQCPYSFFRPPYMIASLRPLPGFVLSAAGLTDVTIDSPSFSDSFLMSVAAQAFLGERLAQPEVQVRRNSPARLSPISLPNPFFLGSVIRAALALESARDYERVS